MSFETIMLALAGLAAAYLLTRLVRHAWTGRFKYGGQICTRGEEPGRYRLELSFDFLTLLIVAGFVLLLLREDRHSSYSLALLTALLVLNLARDAAGDPGSSPRLPGDRMNLEDALALVLGILVFAAAAMLLWLWLGL